MLTILLRDLISLKKKQRRKKKKLFLGGTLKTLSQNYRFPIKEDILIAGQMGGYTG